MSKRNLITEIQQKNARASGRYLHGNLELYELESSFRRLVESDSALIALHVMGIASCIEVGVREAIKRLVDSGSPFLDRSEIFKDHIRFDFALTRALSATQITFGDLVSHSLPVSNLNHIASHFVTLFSNGNDRIEFSRILSEVREYVEPSEEEVFGDSEVGMAQRFAPFLLKDTERLLSDISSIFETRHLVAHEANFQAVSHTDLQKYMTSARSFLNALYELVEQTLNLGMSRSGMAGSVQQLAKAGRVVQEAETIQQHVFEKIASLKSDGNYLPELFNEAIKAFQAHHEAESNLRLALHAPFTGNAMRNIEADVTLQLWKHRMAYLVNLEDQVKFYVDVQSD
ncbi:HEPN domain-containing protein [Xanthomonas arboricola]|uniref:HEPN domain-containing protein n=1 Tax=Xanthomonas TaxID=338 RepID=UPI00141AD8E4|nr:HEPN domain-containing protein [Xanthomonas arboricola]NIK32774.1 hypothetical protein [Xanthomonas arboricola]